MHQRRKKTPIVFARWCGSCYWESCCCVGDGYAITVCVRPWTLSIRSQSFRRPSVTASL